MSTLATVHILHNLQTGLQLVQGLYYDAEYWTKLYPARTFTQLNLLSISDSSWKTDKGREGGNATLDCGVGSCPCAVKSSYTVYTCIQPLWHVMNYRTFLPAFLTKSISRRYDSEVHNLGLDYYKDYSDLDNLLIDHILLKLRLTFVRQEEKISERLINLSICRKLFWSFAERRQHNCLYVQQIC